MRLLASSATIASSFAFASASAPACTSDSADSEPLDAGDAADRASRDALPDSGGSDSTSDSADGSGDVSHDAAVDVGQDDELSLWNGRDLTEWDGDPNIWRVQDGAIVASSASGAVKMNTFLIYKPRTFSNFVLTGEVWLGASGNSGIQYRSRVADAALWSVGGYQLDLGPSYWGQLYEEQGRAILVTSSSACLESGRYDTWLTFEVSVQGTSFVHRLDGSDCISFTESVANRARDGVIALQYHVPGGFELRFRSLRLREQTD